MSLANPPRGCQSFKMCQRDQASHNGVLLRSQLSLGKQILCAIGIVGLSCGYSLPKIANSPYTWDPTCIYFFRFAEKRGTPREIASPAILFCTFDTRGGVCCLAQGSFLFPGYESSRMNTRLLARLLVESDGRYPKILCILSSHGELIQPWSLGNPTLESHS